VATFGTTALKHVATVLVIHAGAETMRVDTLATAGLKRTFHGSEVFVLWGKTIKIGTFLLNCTPLTTPIFMIDAIIKAVSSLFGTKSDRDLRYIRPIVAQINAFGPEMESLSDEVLRGKTDIFRARIAEASAPIRQEMDALKIRLESDEEGLGVDERRDMAEQLDALSKEELAAIEDTLDELLPEAYAVLKETCRRHVGRSWTVAGNEIIWNMVPYDVQLIGAIVLHQGKISEMKTGEGKTLVAIFPAYLNALVGRGVHVVTVNDYLAKRDCEWNEPIFTFHGLRVDCVDRYEPNSDKRRNAYLADITYGTNNEFGFDYLRDNMVLSSEQLVQRGHHYTIVDEVDSVLIDEARTPLIISGPVPVDTQSAKYLELKPRVLSLVEAQKKLVAKYVAEAETLLQNGSDEERAGLQLFRARRGFPKNGRFIKLMQEPQYQRLVQKTEAVYLQDNARNMGVVDEDMFYSVDLKQNSIEMTEKGRELITPSNEDPDFFVIPDMGSETVAIDEWAENRRADGADDATIRRERAEKTQQLNLKFSERADRIHSINQLLKAYTLFERDDEYIVQEGKVLIVDEHTGRVMQGRRYSDGLHQAIEAKENVKVEASTQTYATITLQNYFRMYHKIAGMTGTAVTEEAEFFQIYKLEVIEIPTNRPITRNDMEDLVFRTKREKFNAAIQKIQEYHTKGQPVLVGTTSVEVSETMSRMLQRVGIKHNVLNAKQHQRESEIVAEAGRPGAVTIATNMAGRGTDIKLAVGISDVGGLAILGTERHESRRIDLQLRGRSGRQGDPGESQFYVSLEDDLMRLFGSDRIASVMDRLNFQEGEVIQHPWVTKSLERAQSKVEQNNFSIRKRQLEYDDVLNNQRKVVYTRRKHALLGDRLQTDILNMLQDLVAAIVDEHYKDGDYDMIQEKLMRILAVDAEMDREKWAKLGDDGLIDHLTDLAQEAYRTKSRLLTEPFMKAIEQLASVPAESRPAVVQLVFSDGAKRFRVLVEVDKALETQGMELVHSMERSIVLSVIDERWMEHLRDLDAVKEGIGLRAFGQKDPLLEYKKEAFNMFQSLVDEMNEEIIGTIWKSVPEGSAPPAKAVPQQKRLDMSRIKTRHDSSSGMGITFDSGSSSAPRPPATGGNAPKAAPVYVGPKVGRNDPCPCGSGKKFKNCHGAGA
jgi:preprotein translocase subunit SecA